MAATTNPRVDDYLHDHPKWRAEFEKLRAMLLDTELTEDIKWGSPCYTYNKSVVIILAGFKEYCALSFFKGILLDDPSNILTAPGENSRSVRLAKFTNLQQITDLEAVLKAYILEAIEVEKAGLKVDFKNDEELPIPDEFQDRLTEMPHLQTAFDSLTPGRRRAYLLYFTAPKHSQTRAARVEKCIDMILDGIGLNDGYTGKRSREA
ncbi:MAG TPA: DUF1801 domain-containing protein [Candidatus Saccharimonadales bacterium]|nr:DUF1801 domain-containing protein [Candidatus Saccharimonadales bacterium]